MKSFPHLDAVIVGGGIVGLWSASRLRAQGRRVVLLEADALGCQQTLASQGMIHGGLKYALGGVLTGASEAIASMPERWRACLDGTGELDLRGLKPLSEDNLLFASGSGLGRFTTFFASRTLQGRIRRLEPAQWPQALRGCRGWVYTLNDLVLDTPALLEKLAAGLPQCLYQHALQGSEIHTEADGWRLDLPGQQLFCKELILCAGEGNESLLRGIGADSPKMQRRALRQIIVRGDKLTPLYAHCLTGIRSPEPRLTITSHPDGNGWLWYLGGQLAGADSPVNDAQLCEFARQELQECLPWQNFDSLELSVLAINRAEVDNAGQRPDQPFVHRTKIRSSIGKEHGPEYPSAIVCWPTKLTLAPAAADQIIDLVTANSAPSSRVQKDDEPGQKIDLPIVRSGIPRWLATQIEGQ